MSLGNAFAADISHWKIQKFIKDKQDLKAVEEVLRTNFKTIKRIFLFKASNSGFPCINWIAWSDYCGLC